MYLLVINPGIDLQQLSGTTDPWDIHKDLFNAVVSSHRLHVRI
jgi:hypothetical protein